jgi:hypothetical protein
MVKVEMQGELVSFKRSLAIMNITDIKYYESGDTSSLGILMVRLQNNDTLSGSGEVTLSKCTDRISS